MIRRKSDRRGGLGMRLWPGSGNRSGCRVDRGSRRRGNLPVLKGRDDRGVGEDFGLARIDFAPVRSTRRGMLGGNALVLIEQLFELMEPKPENVEVADEALDDVEDDFGDFGVALFLEVEVTREPSALFQCGR